MLSRAHVFTSTSTIRIVRAAPPAMAALAMLALAACGPVDDHGSDSVDLTVDELVRSARQSCPAHPPPVDGCGVTGKLGGRSSTGGARAVAIAACNGVDDTAAIQAAISQADEVRLPAGTCAVSGLGVSKKPLKLLGQGRDRTVLKYLARAGDSAMLFSNGANTVIADLTLDGSSDSGAQVVGIFLRPKTCAAPVAITRVAIRNIADYGIVVSGDGVGTINGVVDDGAGVGADPVVVTGNRIAGRDSGIYVATTSNFNVRHVQITQNEVVAEHGGAIAIRGLFEATVSENRVRGGNAGVMLESGGQQTRIIGNELTGAIDAGIALGGGALSDGADVSIRGNRVSASGNGILVRHTSTGRFRNVTIAGNDLTGNAATGITISAGTQVTVARNRLAANAVAGLTLETGPVVAACGARCTAIDGVSIVENVFRAGTATTSAGLSLADATARGVTVSCNDLRHDAPVPPYQPVALVAPPAAGELTFDGNQGWPVLAPAP